MTAVGEDYEPEQVPLDAYDDEVLWNEIATRVQREAEQAMDQPTGAECPHGRQVDDGEPCPDCSAPGADAESDGEEWEVRNEVRRLRVRAEARRRYDIEQNEGVDLDARLLPGDTVLDTPPEVPSVWGDGHEVLWAEGESLLVVAPTGVGKTTLSGQVVAGLVGIGGFGDLLGLPVAERERVLYIAADRPNQIMRATARQLRVADPDLLRDRLVWWRGPLVADIGQRPETLVELCRKARATTVVIDSLKDVAAKLAGDEAGPNVNIAMQHCLAEGIDVLAMHHQRKGQNGTKPDTIADVYGNTMITAGAGSVVLLWGEAGDAVIDLKHLKQPAEPVGPLQIEHDHVAGRSAVYKGWDPLQFLMNRGQTGATSTDAARAWFGEHDVDRNQQKKAKRKLDGLVRKGLAEVSDDGGPGGKGGSRGTVYRAQNLTA